MGGADPPRPPIGAVIFFGGFQALMPVIGWFRGLEFSDFVNGYDHWIAFILLVLIGGKMI